MSFETVLSSSPGVEHDQVGAGQARRPLPRHPGGQAGHRAPSRHLRQLPTDGEQLHGLNLGTISKLCIVLSEEFLGRAQNCCTSGIWPNLVERRDK